MQKFILKNKNKIIVINGLLIALAFIIKWTISNINIYNILLIIASIIGAIPIAIQAYQSARVKVVSIDILVILAVIGAFIISNYEESAIVTFLFLLGAYLEHRTLNKTRSAIKELVEIAPESALKLINDEFIEVDIEDVNPGDILLVKTGAKIPVDGVVTTGSASINEASITGESLPVSKEKGSKVFAGTILDNGTIQIKAEKVGENTTFGKIIELVEEAQDSKSEAEKFIDKFSKHYTPVILIIGLVVWIITKNTELAIMILVLGCPGALVIGVPVSHVAGIGNGAKNGVLLKGSEVISDFSKLDTIIFDKTGTLTLGKPKVSSKHLYGEETEDALRYLASIESESDHPLAKAIIEEIGKVKLLKVTDTTVNKGGGIIGTINNKKVVVGNLSLMNQENIKLNKKIKDDIILLEEDGNSLVITAVDNEVKVLMGIKDQIRPGVKEELQKIRNLGVKNLIMLSGDNQRYVDLVGKELGISTSIGNMLPEDKSKYVKKLIEEENRIVAFVGDGVNDSPSLATAHIGIAMGSGTDVAIETSDVVLINSEFNQLTYALKLVKSISRNMKQNIVISLGVVVILLLSVLFSNWMNVSIGMLVHEGSVLVVILNGMRLIRNNRKEV